MRTCVAAPKMIPRLFIFLLLVVPSISYAQVSGVQFGHTGAFGLQDYFTGDEITTASGGGWAGRIREGIDTTSDFPAYLTSIIFRAHGSTSAYRTPSLTGVDTYTDTGCSVGNISYTTAFTSSWTVDISSDTWMLVGATTTQDVSLSNVRCIEVTLFATVAGQGTDGDTNKYQADTVTKELDVLWLGDSSPNASSSVPSLGQGAPTFDLGQCNLISGNFSMSGCVAVLLGWDAGAMALAMHGIQTDIFRLWPFGYLTRFAVIMAGGATTTVPSLVLSTPLSVNGVEIASTTSTINLQAAMDSSYGYLSSEDSNGNSFWSVFMSIFTPLAYAMWIIGIIVVAMGLHPHEQKKKV